MFHSRPRSRPTSRGPTDVRPTSQTDLIGVPACSGQPTDLFVARARIGVAFAGESHREGNLKKVGLVGLVGRSEACRGFAIPADLRPTCERAGEVGPRLNPAHGLQNFTGPSQLLQLRETPARIIASYSGYRLVNQCVANETCAVNWVKL